MSIDDLDYDGFVREAGLEGDIEDAKDSYEYNTIIDGSDEQIEIDSYIFSDVIGAYLKLTQGHGYRFNNLANIDVLKKHLSDSFKSEYDVICMDTDGCGLVRNLKK